MALVYADRVKETTATVGTGTYTLTGARTGFRSFTSVLSNGQSTTYMVTDGVSWEVAEGVFTTVGTTLTRGTVIASSNGGAAVSWAAGTKDVSLVQSARDAQPIPSPASQTAGRALVSDPGASNLMAWLNPHSVMGAFRGRTGALASTYDRAESAPANISANTSGVLNLVRILLPKGLSITSITFFSATTALASGSNQWFGLFDSSRNKLALTADDTNTAWAANTAKTLNISGGPYVTTYAGFFYLGILVVATTMPTLAGFNPATLAVIDAATPPVRGTSSTGLTNPASCPATAGAITVTGKHFYAEVS